MNIEKLIDELKNMNIHLDISNDQIKIFGEISNISSELLTKIESHKIEILQFITNGDRNFSKIKNIEKRQFYELSSAQKRMFLIQKRQPDSIAYNLQRSIYLGQAINILSIENVFLSVIKSHESLRMFVQMVDDRPSLRILDNLSIKLGVQYVHIDKFEDFKRQFSLPFNLESPPLFRSVVVNVESIGFYLLFDVHHILVDEQSLEILKVDFERILKNLAVLPLRLQYKDFAFWQNRNLKGINFNNEEKHWSAIYSNGVPVVTFPGDGHKVKDGIDKGAMVSFSFDNSVVSSNKEFCKQLRMSPFALYMSFIYFSISKLSCSDDIVIGIPVTMRNHVDLDGIVGIFVNMLAVRTKIMEFESVKKNFEVIKGDIFNALDNRNYPFERLVERFQDESYTGNHPIFDIVFTFNQYDFEFKEDIDSNIITVCPVKFDLYFNISLYRMSVVFNIAYSTVRFSSIFIKGFINTIKNVVRHIINDINQSFSSVNILGEVERELVVNGFNDTDKSFRKDLRIHELFEEQVRLHPDKIALEHGGLQMSYGLLNELSNQLAFYLRDKYGVGREDLVAIKMQKNEWIVICVLGILKLGSAYVPIDPSYPQERIEYILNDTGCRIILDESEIERFKSEGSKYGTENLLLPGSPEDLAYVIYTSGTTGKPKGVLVEHQALVNVTFSWRRNYELQKEIPILLSIANISFDVFTGDLWRVLVNNGKLIFLSQKEILDIPFVCDIIEIKEITIFDSTPVFSKGLISHAQSFDVDISSLKILIVGSDLITQEDYNFLFKVCSKNNIRLINSFGVTECCVDSTCFEGPLKDKILVPIGRPIDNTSCYILNFIYPTPVSVIGEIYIGGLQVGRGYLNHPELTSEKFVENPFRSGERMYRTGDLGRWLEDGNIEFLGRIDDQVKIRGYRIEPQEVVLCLERKEGIRGSVVLNRGEGEDKYLCAYYVSDELIPVSELRSHVLKYLPDYMVPSSFVRIETIPLNSNGKVDRGSLPDPEFEPGVEGYQGAGNDTEREMIRIWSEVLKIPEEVIGVRSNFFELGGHSLRATILTGRIHKSFNVRVPLVEVFKTPTIRELSEYIVHANRVDYSVIRSVEKRRYYELSSAQKRLYFLQQLTPESISYNMPLVVTLSGGADNDRLENVFEKLIARHESLRTSFITVNNEPVQRIWDKIDFKITHLSASEEEMQDLIKNCIKPFDLSKDILIRIFLITIQGKKDQVLIIDQHHIISDGTTGIILTNDFWHLMEGKTLPDLRIQYKDYSIWINSNIQKEKTANQKKYWIKKLSGEC